MTRRAFTLLELIIVVVIVGIIAGATSQGVVQIMKNYATQQEYSKLEADGSNTIDQISNLINDGALWDSLSIKEGNNFHAISLTKNAEEGKLSDKKTIVFIEKKERATMFVNLSRSKEDMLYIYNNTTPINNTDSIYFPYIENQGGAFEKYYAKGDNQPRSTFNVVAINDVNKCGATNNNVRCIVLNRHPRILGDTIQIVKSGYSEIVLKDEKLSIRKNGDEKQSNVIARGIKEFYLWGEGVSSLIRLRICFDNKSMKFMKEYCKEGIIFR